MTASSTPTRKSTRSGPAKGLRQFLTPDQQHAWLEGDAQLSDIAERTQSLEHRFKYAARLDKLLRRPQAMQVVNILRLYGATCLPIPRTTERFYWSVSCLPSTNDKPLARVNASWMELFTLLPDYSSPLVGECTRQPCPGDRAVDVPRTSVLLHGGGRPASAGQENRLSASLADADDAPPPNPPHKGEGSSAQTGLRARVILHLADFTTDGSPDPDQLDTDLLESCAERPEDVDYSIWRDGKAILIAKLRGAASIRAFITHPHGLRAIRNFNLTHMNRGRNAYQASHCYSLADVMVGD